MSWRKRARCVQHIHTRVYVMGRRPPCPPLYTPAPLRGCFCLCFFCHLKMKFRCRSPCNDIVSRQNERPDGNCVPGQGNREAPLLLPHTRTSLHSKLLLSRPQQQQRTASVRRMLEVYFIGMYRTTIRTRTDTSPISHFVRFSLLGLLSHSSHRFVIIGRQGYTGRQTPNETLAG